MEWLSPLLQAFGSELLAVLIGGVLAWFGRGFLIRKRIETEVAKALEMESDDQRTARSVQREENLRLQKEVLELRERVGQRTRAGEIRDTAEAAEKLQNALDLKERREQRALMRQLGFGHLIDDDR